MDVCREVAGEGAEVLTLGRAAEDEAERRAIGGHTTAGCGRVRRLRVVDPANAVQLAYLLQAVRNAGERAECLGDGVVGHAGCPGRRGRGSRVLPIVEAGNQGLRG